MDDFINTLLDRASDTMARRPGLLPLLGIALILFNFLLQIFPGPGIWLVDSNLFLHLGLVIGILGLMLVRALG
jgi:hypothetical protein